MSESSSKDLNDYDAEFMWKRQDFKQDILDI